uniref:Uncharacterized protein n=1 Tax=Anguilla anguilla TaxID=7936 RepID=A0A0E9RIX5_ANGAN
MSAFSFQIRLVTKKNHFHGKWTQRTAIITKVEYLEFCCLGLMLGKSIN